jgi:hypothetical protein
MSGSFLDKKNSPHKVHVTRPQLLEGPKYESQVENNGKGKSRDTLPNSQH